MTSVYVSTASLSTSTFSSGYRTTVFHITAVDTRRRGRTPLQLDIVSAQTQREGRRCLRHVGAYEFLGALLGGLACGVGYCHDKIIAVGHSDLYGHCHGGAGQSGAGCDHFAVCLDGIGQSFVGRKPCLCSDRAIGVAGQAETHVTAETGAAEIGAYRRYGSRHVVGIDTAVGDKHAADLLLIREVVEFFCGGGMYVYAVKAEIGVGCHRPVHNVGSGIYDGIAHVCRRYAGLADKSHGAGLGIDGIEVAVAFYGVEGAVRREGAAAPGPFDGAYGPLRKIALVVPLYEIITVALGVDETAESLVAVFVVGHRSGHIFYFAGVGVVFAPVRHFIRIGLDFLKTHQLAVCIAVIIIFGRQSAAGGIDGLGELDRLPAVGAIAPYSDYIIRINY